MNNAKKLRKTTEWERLEISQRRQWHPTPVLLPGESHGQRSLVGYSPWGHKDSDTTEQLHFHFHFHALEKEMATHSSVLAWRIPGMGEPGGLPSMGSHRVGHDWRDLAAAADSHLVVRNVNRDFMAPVVQMVENLHAMQEPWVGKIPWRRAWQPTPVFLPGESHGQRSLVGYSPRGQKKVRHGWATNTTHMYVSFIQFPQWGNL